jgi:glycine cleavage system aminomethyltransferase T
LLTDPLHDRLAARGAVFGFRAGWERPLWFAPAGVAPQDDLTFRRPNWFAYVGEECRAVRAGVGMLDQTSFGKYEVSGPGAEAFLEGLSANALPAVGRIAVTQLLNERGGIECDLTVTRRREDSFYVISAAATETHDHEHLRRRLPADGSVRLDNVTAATGVLTIAGPRSRELLAAITDADVSNEAFGFLTARRIHVGSAPVLAMRISYVGELGWELHTPIAYLQHLDEALRRAGEPLGIVDVGYRALESMRMEKGYRLFGADLSPDHTPFEAGLDRFVKLDGRSFEGAQALRRQLAEGVPQRLACLTVDTGEAIPHGDEPVLDPDDRVVGYISAAEYGHVVGATIALAYLPAELDAPGIELTVDVLGERHRARVVEAPLYDPGDTKLRS